MLRRVYAVKRLIGRSFSDDTVQGDKKQWPFTVAAGPGDAPRICVEHAGEPKRFAPEELSAMLLAQMKADAEDFLDEDVTQAVVTVPGYFTEAQRAATKAAGEIAGLDIIRILNEPTAGALAYGCDRSRHVRSNAPRRGGHRQPPRGALPAGAAALHRHGRCCLQKWTR